MTDSEDDARTLARPKADARPSAQSGDFVLRVVEGPDLGTTLALESVLSARALIGQSPACDLRLTDRQVSRRHAALERSGDGLRLVDLGSTNGTFVAGLRVRDVWLSGGELIRLGESSLSVERAASPALAPPPRTQFVRLFGRSTAMQRVYALAERVAQVDVPLLIEGETGTGKELLAESIHEAGPRAQGPFVVFDCTAVPASLIESALFGHERGAFTGATDLHRGVFEQAHGGTLLLDEIGDLELTLQAKLLRAIERKEVRRVGGDRWLKVDVRVMSATRRDLDHEVQEGRFRDDLFYRLAVARLELPALVQRTGDVSLLARKFWHELGGEGPIDEGWLARLESDPWPGNVRQLFNEVARRVALGEHAGEGEREGTHDGQSEDPFQAILAREHPLPVARQLALDAFLALYVERALARHGGNVVQAARASGVARRYFQLVKSRKKTP